MWTSLMSSIHSGPAVCWDARYGVLSESSHAPSAVDDASRFDSTTFSTSSREKCEEGGVLSFTWSILVQQENKVEKLRVKCTVCYVFAVHLCMYRSATDFVK
jgi:hypothetical protein